MEPQPFSIKVSQTDPNDPFKILVSIDRPFEAEAPSRLPYDEAGALHVVLRTLEATSFASTDYDDDEVRWLQSQQLLTSEHGGLDFSPTTRKEIGKKLFQCLFPTEKMRSIYDQERRSSTADRREIHFQICFGANAPLVGAYPWELLHHEVDFLIGGGRGTLTRYVTLDSPPPFRDLPPNLNVLLVAPRPADPMLGRLGTSEVHAIRCAMERARKRFTLEPQEVPSFPDFEDYLSKHRGNESPDIIHFDGHGVFGRRCVNCGTVTTHRTAVACRNCSHTLDKLQPQGYLAFADTQGRTDYKSADEFSDLVRQALVSVNGEARGGIRLVVLSACRSGVARDAESVFNGVAQRLVDAGVPAVVAFQFSVKADAARRFAELFYQQVSEGAPLRTAMSWGRTALGGEGDQWYRPVLYLRWRDNEGGRLFPEPPEPPVSILSLDEKDRSQLADLLVRSGRVQGHSARRALCIDISVDPNLLEFMEGNAPSSFATQLIQHLHATDDELALTRLCSAMQRNLRGRYLSDLERLRVKIEGGQI